jgi:hypothetical protein
MNEETKKEILELHKKQLFKDVLGAIMRTEYEEITGQEVVRIAMGAIGSFAKREGVRLEWEIKD